MEKIFNIVIAGVGGQGNLLSAEILAKAANLSGYEVVIGEVLSASQRMGSVLSIVRIVEKGNNDTILSPQICSRDADLLFAFEPLEGLRRYRKYGAEKTKVVLNSNSINPASYDRTDPEKVSVDYISEEISQRSKILQINATDLAYKNFNDGMFANILMISKALSNDLLPLTFNSVVQALQMTFTGKHLIQNLDALNFFCSSKLENSQTLTSKYKLMTSNEACAIGALAAGVEFCYGYPGSPVTEITERLIRESNHLKNESTNYIDKNFSNNKSIENTEIMNFPGLHASWALNEKIALEKGVTAALAGSKALVVMKQNGLNVVSDFLLTQSHTGITTGSLVLIVGDDPIALASTSNIDSRWILHPGMLPILEPSTPAEAETMVHWAFELSETLQQIVVIRLTSRTANQKGLVQFAHDANELHWSAHWDKMITENSDAQETNFAKPSKWDFKNIRAFNLPVMQNQLKQIGKSEVAKNIAESAMFNRVYSMQVAPEVNLSHTFRKTAQAYGYIEIPDSITEKKAKYQKPELVIFSSGMAFLAASEAIKKSGAKNRIRLVKLGFFEPLPLNFVANILHDADKVLVIEESSDYLETQLKSNFASMKIKWLGRQTQTYDFLAEITPDLVLKIIQNELNLKDENTVTKIKSFSRSSSEKTIENHNSFQLKHHNLPIRELRLCAGCPHRASFWILKKVLEDVDIDYSIFGDIGCYTLGGLASGFNLLQTANCMGSSIGMGAGFAELSKYKNGLAISVIGDSTFLHSGLPAIIDAKLNNLNLLVIILDNSYIAMTGGQETVNSEINVVSLLEALKIQVLELNPFEFNESICSLFDFIEAKGIRCAIFKADCAQQKQKNNALPTEEIVIDPEKCTYGSEDCPKLCISTFACPAFEYDEKTTKIKIRTDVCKRCGFCIDVCTKDAIVRKPTQKNE